MEAERDPLVFTERRDLVYGVCVCVTVFVCMRCFVYFFLVRFRAVVFCMCFLPLSCFAVRGFSSLANENQQQSHLHRKQSHTCTHTHTTQLMAVIMTFGKVTNQMPGAEGQNIDFMTMLPCHHSAVN